MSLPDPPLVWLAAEEGGFDGLAVLEEPVADAVELGQGQGRGGGQAEQFEGGGVLAEPDMGLAFGGGMQHVGEDEGDGDSSSSIPCPGIRASL